MLTQPTANICTPPVLTVKSLTTAIHHPFHFCKIRSSDDGSNSTDCGNGPRRIFPQSLRPKSRCLVTVTMTSSLVCFDASTREMTASADRLVTLRCEHLDKNFDSLVQSRNTVINLSNIKCFTAVTWAPPCWWSCDPGTTQTGTSRGNRCHSIHAIFLFGLWRKNTICQIWIT